jgi:hypothetical protein
MSAEVGGKEGVVGSMAKVELQRKRLKELL